MLLTATVGEPIFWGVFVQACPWDILTSGNLLFPNPAANLIGGRGTRTFWYIVVSYGLYMIPYVQHCYIAAYFSACIHCRRIS